MGMSDILSGVDLTHASEQELIALERQIARKHMAGLSLPMVIWPFANIAIWLSLWPLVLTGSLSLWVAFPIACCNMMAAYLPSHDAQHDSYARPGEKLRWLNETIGHSSALLLAYSYRVLRETHLEHHKHTNKDELDPDYLFNRDATAWKAVLKTIISFQPASEEAKIYLKTLERLDTPNARRGLRDQLVLMLGHLAILFTLAANGFALEALLLWWLPLKIGVIYLRFYLSWAPHEGAKTGRYRNTKSFQSIGGDFGSSGMTAHVVHHLHPRIPHNRTVRAFREMLPILRVRNVDLGGH
jgi:beta-carotene hydroxylase